MIGSRQNYNEMRARFRNQVCLIVHKSVFTLVEVGANVRHIFKSTVGVPFPRNYQSTVKKIMSRLYRVFVHVYIHHFDKLVGLGAVSSYFVVSSLSVVDLSTKKKVSSWNHGR